MAGSSFSRELLSSDPPEFLPTRMAGKRRLTATQLHRMLVAEELRSVERVVQLRFRSGGTMSAEWNWMARGRSS